MNKLEQLLREQKKIRISKILELKSQKNSLIYGFDTTIKQECILQMIPLVDCPSLEIKQQNNDEINKKLEEINKEVQIMKNCNNKIINQYIDSFQIENNFFIKVENPNKTLQDWILEKKGDPIITNREDLLKICSQFVNGMIYLHHYNRFLMDYSLSNIFISEEKEVKFMFGRQISSEDKDLIYQQYIKSITNETYFLYPPEILSESLNCWEQFIKRKEKNDLWSLGVLILILLGKTPNEILNLQKCEDSYDSINSLLQDVFNLNPHKRQNISQIANVFNIAKARNKKSSQENSKVTQEEQEIKLSKLQSNNDQLDSNMVQTENEQLNKSQSTEEIQSKEQLKQQQEIETQKEPELFKKDIMLLIQDFMKKGELEKAVLQIKQYLNSNPNDIEIFKILTNIYQKRGNTDSEISNLKKIIEINPTDPEVYFQLGKAYLGKSRYEEALKQFNKCIEIDKFHIDSMIKIGDYYLTLKELDKAENSYQNGYKVNQNHSLILYKLGLVKKLKNKFEEALNYFDQSLKINGFLKECQTDYQWTFKKIKDNEIAEYKKQIEIRPEDFNLHYKLGLAYKSKDQIDLAIESFSKSLQINPTQNEVCIFLGDCFAQQNKIKIAIGKYKDSLELNPQCPKTWYKLGLAYISNKKNLKALRSLFKSFSLDKNNQDCKIKLCELSKKQMDNSKLSLHKVILSTDDKKIKINQFQYQYSSELMIEKLKKQLQNDYSSSLMNICQFENFYHTLGLIYQALNIPKKAILQMKKSLILNPLNYTCFLDIGAVYGESHKHTQAVFYSNQALQKNKFIEKVYYIPKEKREKKYQKSLKEFILNEPPKINKLLKSKAYFNLGLLNNSKNIFETFSYFKRALKKNLQNQDCWYYLGLKYLSLDQSENAIDMFKECQNINRYHAKSHMHLGEIYKLKNIANLDLIHSKLYVESKYFNKGVYYLKIKNYEKSIKNLLKCEEINPINSDCYYYLSKAFNFIGNYESQMRNLKTCIELNPTHSKSLKTIYKLQEKEKSEGGDFTKQFFDVDKKEDVSKLTNHLDWNYIEAYENELSEMLTERSNKFETFKQGLYQKSRLELDKSILYFKEYIQQEPKDFLGFYLLGNLYEKKDKYEDSLKAYSISNQLCSNNFNTNFKRGQLLINLKDYKEALKSFKIADQIIKNNEQTYFKLAQCYYSLNEYCNSLVFIEKCLQLNPKNNLYSFYKLLIEGRYKDLNDFFPQLKLKAQSLYDNSKGLIPQDLLVIIDCIINEKDHNECKGFCLYQKSKQSLVHKKVEEAANYLKKGVQLNPSYLPFRICLAQTLVSLKKPEKALEEIEKVIIEDEDNFSANFIAGQCYLEKGRYDQSINHLLVCKEQNTESFEVLKLLGDSYKESKQFKEAIQYYNSCKELCSINSDVVEQLANVYQQQGEFQLSYEQYKRCVELNKKNPDFHYKLAQALVLMKQYDNAILSIQECIKLDSRYLNAYNLQGEIQIQLGLLNQAIASFKKQGQVNKTDKQFLLNLGKVYIQKNDYAEAITSLSKYMNANPQVLETYDMLNKLFEIQKQPKKQVKILESLQKIDPINEKLINLRIAEILWKNRFYEEAVIYFEKYTADFKADKDIYFKIALCYERILKYNESLIAFQNCLTLFPEKSDCYFHLALIHLQMKNYKEANNFIQFTLASNPGHVQGLYILSQIYYQEKNYEEALRLQEICINQCDFLQDIYYQIGLTYKKLNNLDYSSTCFEVCLRKQPNNTNYKLQLGYIQFKRSNYKEALTILKEIETLNQNNPKFLFYQAESYFNDKQYHLAQTIYQKCFDCEYSKYTKASFQKVYTSLLKQRKLKEIKHTLNKCLIQNENDTDILYLLAEVYITEGLDYEQALNYIQKCLQIKPDYLKCKALQAHYFLQVERNPQKVVDFMSEFSEEFILNNVNSLLALSEAYFDLNNEEKSQYYLDQIFNIDKLNEGSYYLQGLFYMKKNENLKAIAEFQKNSLHDKSFYQIGVIKEKHKKFDEAREAYIKAKQIYSENPLYYKALGKLEFQQKQYIKASSYCETYNNMVQEPEVSMINIIARSYFHQNKYLEALKQLQVNLNKTEDDQNYLLAGQCHLKLNSFLKAEECLKKSIKLNNQNSDSFYYLGNCQRLLDKLKQAKESYSNCIAITKEHAQSHNYLGQIYYYEKNYKKAHSHLLESTLYDSKNPESIYFLGKYYQKVANNTVSAIEQFKKCLTVDKTYKEAAKRLMKIYISQSSFEEADQVIVTYPIIYDNNIKTQLFVGNFYFTKYKHEKAIEMFERALRLDIQNIECQIKIASSYFMKKQFNKCEETLKKYAINLKKSYEFYYLNSQINIQKESDANVVSNLKKCQELDPNNENSYYLSAYFLNKKNSKLVQETFDKGQSINSSTNELGFVLNGIIQISQGNNEEGLRSFKQCIRQYPMSENCLLNMGLYYICQNQFEEARDTFQKVINIQNHTLYSIYSKPLTDKELLRCKQGLAQSYQGLKEYQKAQDIIQQCLTTDPNNPENIQINAKILHQRGQITQSIVQFQKYLQINPLSDDVHYLLGKARLEVGCPDQAIFSLKKCLAINPKFPNIYQILGEAYESDQQYKEALVCYQKQIELEPTNSKILFRLTLILISFDRFQDAQEFIKKSLLINSNDYLTYTVNGVLYKRQGFIHEAIESFNKSLQLNQNNIYTLFNIAQCYSEIGNVKKEKESYKKILKQQPHDRKALNNLGTIYRLKGKYDKAIPLFSQCIKIDQYFCEYYTNLGLCYHAKGEYDLAINTYQIGYNYDRINIDCIFSIAASYKAKGEVTQATKYYQKILKINPNFVGAYYNLAILQKQQGNVTEAITNYKLCIEKDPNHLNSIVNLAICYKAVKDYDNAKKLLKKALELDQNHELANFNISLLYRSKYKNTKELIHLMKALSQSPQNAQYLHNIGICHRLSGNLQEALIYYKQSIQFDSQNAKYYYNLADLYHSLRQYQEEVQCYKKCILINPNFEQAYHNMGASSLYLKNYQESIESFQKCLEINPKNTDCLFNLGNVYASQDQTEQAKVCYENCLEIKPNFLDCLNNLAIVLAKQKKYTEAISVYERCINISPNEEFRKKLNAVYNLLKKQN